jgi:3-methylfumaryl-CoA hydratase
MLQCKREDMQNTDEPAQVQDDVIDPARAQALAATLGFGVVDPADLPPFFHQIWFWQALPPDLLGRDGHPAPGQVGLVPDTGLPRRMWAGGELAFHAPLRAGVAAQKRSWLEGVTHKQGRSGLLAFARLRHEIWQGGVCVLTEWQDLVYRHDPAPGTPPPPPAMAPPDAGAEARDFSTTTLFRYSALTFNGHRIHYDLEYAQNVEGYPGLVVHGPLLAQVMMLRAARRLGRLATFRFRAVSPLFHFETATFCAEGDRDWVRGPDGRLCMQGFATA